MEERSQDDTYTESYISTIGVDFVRFLLVGACGTDHAGIIVLNPCRKSGLSSWMARLSSCKSCGSCLLPDSLAFRPFLTGSFAVAVGHCRPGAVQDYN